MMNILIDVRLLGRGGHSGVEEYTYQLVDHLLALPTDNRFILFYNGFFFNPLPRHWFARPNVTVVNWHIPNRLLDLASRFLCAPAVDIRTGADIVFSPHLNIIVSRRAPRILTIHDLSFIHHPQFFTLRQRFWHFLQGYKNQARTADAVVVDSQFTARDVENTLAAHPSKIHCIYPGIGKTFTRGDRDETKLNAMLKKYGIALPYILFLGTLEPRKNITAVIRTFDAVKQDPRLSHLHLVIAGKPGWRYRAMEHEMRRSPHGHDIRCIGPVENEERVLLYTGASAFVYPSFFEGFGFPPLEALACGTPVIVSNRTSLPETTGGCALSVDPWRVGEFARALTVLVTDDALRARLVSCGRAHAATFSWQKTAHELLTLFTQCAKK